MHPYLAWIPLRWARSTWERPRGPLPWSARRLAAAGRAVRRELDAVPLFPELARYRSIEERVAQMEAGREDFHRAMRAHRAAAWRRARAELARLPRTTRAGVLRYWARGHLPPDPGYLLSLLHDLRARHWAPWRALRRLRHYTLRRPFPYDDSD